MEMQISEFNVTEAALAHAETFKSLKILNLEDKEGYKQVYEARISVKKMRLDIEKKRKELREFWLNGAKKVQGEAKQLTDRLEPIEEYLEAEQKKIDDEKERIKEEKKAADAQKIQDRVEKVVNLGSPVSLLMLSSMTDMEFEEHLAALQEEKQAKEAALQKEKQEQEEKEAMLEKERKEREAALEQERKEKEVALEQEKKALQQEQLALEQERKKQEAVLEEERKKQEAILQEERDKLKKEQEAMDAEKARLAEQAIAKLKAEEAEQLAKVGQTDLEKLYNVISALDQITRPEVESAVAKEIVLFVDNSLLKLVADISGKLEALNPNPNANDRA